MILKATGVGKSFQTPAGEISVLADLELAVMEGETVAIVGESGSGKSTLLSLLAGLDEPTVVDESAHRGSTPVEEQEEGSREWIVLQLSSAKTGQGIDSFTPIDGFNRDQDLHVGCDLQHQADLANSRKMTANSMGETPATSALIKPWDVSTSNWQLIDWTLMEPDSTWPT